MRGGPSRLPCRMKSKGVVILKKEMLLFFMISLLMQAVTGYAEQAVGKWQLNDGTPRSPLNLVVGELKLEILSGLGPVYDYDHDILGPEDYDVELVSSHQESNSVVYECRASYEEFKADYTLEFSLLDDGAMELLVGGSGDVSSFKIGNIKGSDESYKLFYTGEREPESHQHNDNYPGMIYISSAKLYLYGFWDKDYTHASKPQNRSRPKQNFIVKTPPVTVDAHYRLMTDGSRQPLKERYVFRFSEDLWQAYGPVLNKPSPYGKELARTVFFDGWNDKFNVGVKGFEFLNEAVPEEVKFYTVIQKWQSWDNWDQTNPDAFRLPDHTTPCSGYGTTDELRQFLSLAQARGYAGFRYNYVHVGSKSWSFKEGFVKKALKSSGKEAWFTNFDSIKPLMIRQEQEAKETYNPTASLHDQWGSVGSGYPVVNFDAGAPGAATVSKIRNDIREVCLASKKINRGPISSESMISEFLYGEYLDTGDYCIFGANQRFDFSPEYKLHRLHELTTVHAMGLGYRHYYPGNWKVNKEPGSDKYFGSDEELDSYRACEVLYGNGAYLYVKAPMRKVHMLTECLTIGLAQRYYAMQPVDYVKYSTGGRFKDFQKIIPKVSSLDELHSWYKRFHIRYKNGCNVWINRDENSMEIRTPNNEMITLAKNCWLVFMEDGSFIAYTAVVSDPVVAGFKARADFCEDKNLGIKYANPRRLDRFMGVSKPTVWQNGKVRFVLQDPNTTLAQMCK